MEFRVEYHVLVLENEVVRGEKDMMNVVLRELEEGRIEPTEEMAEEKAPDIFGTPEAEEDAEA